MIKLLLFTILFFLAYTFFTAASRLLTGGRQPPLPPEKTRRGEEMVRDPQCGTYVPRGQALEKTIGGEKVYFCSSECHTAFRQRTGKNG
jgi:uncharacterized protein